MLFTYLIQLAAAATFAVAVPQPAARDVFCALCPEADTIGEPLVASSGGTQGVPRFCGFQADATATVAPTTICFYSNDGNVFFDSTGLCPATTELYSPCPFVP